MADEYIELEDRKIKVSDLEKHKKLVEQAAMQFNSKVVWEPPMKASKPEVI